MEPGAVSQLPRLWIPCGVYGFTAAFMDSLLNRYRNVTVLVLVIMAQLVLLAYQVKSESDVRLIRVWAVTAVMPFARALEAVRSGVVNFVGNYINLRDTKDQ